MRALASAPSSWSSPRLVETAPSGGARRLVWCASLFLLGCAPSAPPIHWPDAAAVDARVDAPTIDGRVAAPTPDPQPDGPPAACAGCPGDQICVRGACQPRGDLVTPTFPSCSTPPCLNVLNACPVPLWIHALATVAIDGGAVRRLDPGQQWQYPALPLFGGGRLYAYYEEPGSHQETAHPVSDRNQFVEMTVDRDPVSGALAQNYNISYVDHLALPVLVKGGGACADTRCGARFGDWTAALATCPTELRNQHEALATCTGSYDYCITADGPATYDSTRPYCSKMRQAHGFPGSAIYGGSFPDHAAEDVAFWDGVAAWNRGSAPGDADDGHYYQRQPYNDYAAWIHHVLGCRRVYAFSTDDHQDQAGFVRCVSPTLDVIWCPYR